MMFKFRELIESQLNTKLLNDLDDNIIRQINEFAKPRHSKWPKSLQEDWTSFLNNDITFGDLKEKVIKNNKKDEKSIRSILI